MTNKIVSLLPVPAAGSIKLRPYQEKVRDALLATGDRVVIDVPTRHGMGLSYISVHQENVRKLLAAPKTRRDCKFSFAFSATYNGRPPRKTIMQHAIQSVLSKWSSK